MVNVDALMYSVLVKAVAMPDPFNLHNIAAHMKLHSVIAGANPILARQISDQRLGSAYRGPIR
jgi:hypothetical protein